MRTRRTTAALGLLAGGLLASVAVADAVPDGKPVASSRRPGAAGAGDRDLVELGRRLFFDPAVSRSGMRACSDCHDPDHAYSDPLPSSLDERGGTSTHAQTLVDVGDSDTFHWNGEFASVAAVVVSRLAPVPSRRSFGSYDRRMMRRMPMDPPPPPPPPLASPGSGSVVTESGFVSAAVDLDAMPSVGSRLTAARRYREASLAAFADASLDNDRIATALDAYVRTIRSGESAYDRFVAGEEDALSPSARRGLALFSGAGGCASCHSTAGPRAPFSDYRLHVVPDPAAPGTRAAGSSAPSRMAFRTPSVREPIVPKALLRKTPTLRDVAPRGVWTDTGECATLEDAIRVFLPAIDPVVPVERLGSEAMAAARVRATAAAVVDLAAFLRSLTSDRRPGLASLAWDRRARVTRLRFVDADARPLALLPVTLVPAGDPLPGADARKPVAHTTDENGFVEYAPPLFTHVRIVVEGGLWPSDGPLVPDTCQSGVVTLPFRGRATVAVRLGRSSGGEAIPSSIVVEHVNPRFFPERRVPTTVLHLLRQTPIADGACVAVYDGRMRTDVGIASRLVIPGAFGGGTRPFLLRRDEPAAVE